MPAHTVSTSSEPAAWPPAMFSVAKPPSEADPLEPLLAARHFTIARAFAIALNTRRIEPLREVLAPGVIYRSEWAGVSLRGIEAVLDHFHPKCFWFHLRALMRRPQRVDWTADVVLLPDGHAATACADRSRDPRRIESLTTFTSANGRVATAMEVTTQIPLGLRRFGYYPPTT